MSVCTIWGTFQFLGTGLKCLISAFYETQLRIIDLISFRNRLLVENGSSLLNMFKTVSPFYREFKFQKQKIITCARKPSRLKFQVFKFFLAINN
jgi:hypothetical protein